MNRISWKWIAALCTAALLFFFSEGARSYRNKKKYLLDLQKQLNQVRMNNKTLAIEIERLKSDPRAIEQIARRELGLIQPGEIEYRFVVQSSSGK